MVTGTDDNRFDPQKRRRPGVLGQTLGRRAVPDVDNDIRVGKGQEKLSGLIIDRPLPEIPAFGNLGHLPLPGKKRIFMRVHINRLLKGEGGVVTAEAQSVNRSVPHDRNIRLPGSLLEFPS